MLDALFFSYVKTNFSFIQAKVYHNALINLTITLSPLSFSSTMLYNAFMVKFVFSLKFGPVICVCVCLS